MAYGGNFYAIVELDSLGLPFDRVRKDEVLSAGLAVMRAVNEEDRPVHPVDPLIGGCKHVQFLAPGSDGRHSRNAMAIHPGWFDRSPCGTGTSARMAQPHTRGELPLHTDFVNEFFVGTRFVGRLLDTAEIGPLPGVVPEFSGRARITGTANYLLDPSDPFPHGFVLQEVHGKKPVPADPVQDAAAEGVRAGRRRKEASRYGARPGTAPGQRALRASGPKAPATFRHPLRR